MRYPAVSRATLLRYGRGMIPDVLREGFYFSLNLLRNVGPYCLIQGIYIVIEEWDASR